MSGGLFRLGPPRETAEGLEVPLTVPADSPWLTGHFPGQPILPGVAHLHLACLLAALPGGEPAPLAGVEAWRWTDPVTPGEELVASLAPAGEGRSRFALRRAGDVNGGGGRAGVSGGTLVWAPAPLAAAEPSPAPVPGSPPPATALLSLADRLPHQPPARLAEELLEVGPERLVGRGRVGAGHAAVSTLGAPAFLAVELAAQVCAGWPVADGGGRDRSRSSAAARDRREDGGREGRGREGGGKEGGQEGGGEGGGRKSREGGEGSEAGGPGIGYLVRLRAARFARPWLAPDAVLTATVEREARSGPLTVCRFRVADGAGRELAAGSLGVFAPPGG